MRKPSAFTLIELLVVIAIIGILATLIMVKLGNARGKASVSSVKSDLVDAGKSVEIFKRSVVLDGSIILNISNGAPDILINSSSDDSANYTAPNLSNIFAGNMNVTGPKYSYGTKISKVRDSRFTYKYETNQFSANRAPKVSCYILSVSGLQSADADAVDNTFAIANGTSQDGLPTLPPITSTCSN